MGQHAWSLSIAMLSWPHADIEELGEEAELGRSFPRGKRGMGSQVQEYSITVHLHTGKRRRGGD